MGAGGSSTGKKLADHHLSKEELVEAAHADKTLHSLITGKVVNDDYRRFYDTHGKRALGSGMTGTVFQLKSKKTGDPFAAKTLRKKYVRPADVRAMIAEIKLLSQMDHPNIVKLVEVYQDDLSLTMIMEVCSGGELFDNLAERGDYSQRDAAHLFKQMVSAVSYCHRMGIAHRDLKLENFVFSDRTKDKVLKLIDFGLSRKYGAAGVKRMKSMVGTGYYMAPEVLNSRYDHSNKYGEKCDVWSLGVILFMMLTGMPPFDGKDDTEILDNVRKGNLTKFDPREFNYPQARDLITNMLNVDPVERLSCEQVLKHPWFTTFADPSVKATIPKKVVKSMYQFARLENLKKTALEAVTATLTAKEIKELSTSFRNIDTDGSGHISIAEFQKALGAQMQDDAIKKLFEMIDTDHTGLISYSEFIASTLFHQDILTPERLLAAFERLDPDHSGYIEASELAKLLPGTSASDIEKMISECDKPDGEAASPDGKISKAEFISMIPKIEKSDSMNIC